MPTPITSLLTYQRICDEGLLGRMHLMVYEALREHPEGQTRGELKAKFESRLKYEGATEPWVNKLYDLKQMGVAEVSGIRECKITGNLCQTWIANDNIPQPINRVKGLEKEEFEEAEVALQLLMEKAKVTPEMLGVGFERLLAWVAFKARVP